MSVNPPNETAPFDAFAKSLLQEMLAQREGKWIDFDGHDDKEIAEYGAIIARRAADLVATQADNVEMFAHKILLLIGNAYGEIERGVSDNKAVTLQSDCLDEIETLCKQRTTKDIGGVQSSTG